MLKYYQEQMHPIFLQRVIFNPHHQQITGLPTAISIWQIKIAREPKVLTKGKNTENKKMIVFFIQFRDLCLNSFLLM